MGLVRESAVEDAFPDDLRHHTAPRSRRWTARIDRVARAHVPALRVPNRQNDACVRVMLGKLSPEVSGWPIDGGTVALQQTFPIGCARVVCSFPRCLRIGLIEDLHHVMA